MKRLIVFMILLIFAVSGCSLLPGPGSHNSLAGTDNLTVHVRKMQTPVYTGNRAAVIFTLNHVEDSRLMEALDSILRLFAENNVPLDVAVSPDALAKQSELLVFLRDYTDAGIIDISMSGADVNWVDFDSPNVQNVITDLEAQLYLGRARLSAYFGTQVGACVFPYDALNEHNYKCLEGAGFKILCTRNPEGFSSSRQPVNWKGAIDPYGLSRFPVIGLVNYRGVSDPGKVDAQIIEAVKKSDDGLGIAVIEIDPAYFLGDNGKANASSLQQLGNLIKSVKPLGDVITFDGWTRYAPDYSTVMSGKRVMPAYNGGTAIIFRLDDVCKGWYEDTDRAIIEVFKNNGVPLDCGVISNAGGTASYDMPWLKDYVNAGNVGISVHGYDWTYYQLDTTKSNLSYEFIKYKLIRAREDYIRYFGVSPVAITVPTDYYDETGYQAIEDAGFEVFSTQVLIEPHPSNQPVDYYGRKDPGGLYRIPTASDVCLWDAADQKFGGLIDMTTLPGIKDACTTFTKDSNMAPAYAFSCSLCTVITKIDVSAIGIHPAAFIDKDGKPDTAKINQLDGIVKWAKNLGTVTTFEQWYNYTAGKTLP